MNKKGCWVGPKTSKPMQPHQIINPRPRGKELTFFPVYGGNFYRCDRCGKYL